MRRTLMCLIAASALAFGSLSVACGDDDVQSSPQPDSGPPDGNPPPPPPPPADGGDGGGPDGGCTFAGYVINLINTQTTPTAQPDPSLGQGCVDNNDQAEFKPLFP